MKLPGPGIARWLLIATLLVGLALMASQVYAASMSVTAQPLQNNQSDGSLKYTADWSAGTTAVTRHEVSDFAINVSDQVTGLTVGGTKVSHTGTVTVSVTLKDRNGTGLDSGSGTLPTATGAYSVLISMTAGTVAYHKLATASVVYTYTPPPSPGPYYFHSETVIISGTSYYELKTASADGVATTITSTITAGQTGRVSPSSNNGKFVRSLSGFSSIPAATWTATYRAQRSLADFGFVWFTNATDISLATTGSWQTINLSASVPVGATGVMVELVNSGLTNELSGVVRGTEDTNNYMSNVLFSKMEAETHRWQIVKLDASRQIQGYIESTDIDFKLLGYTIGSDPAYFAVPVNKTPATTGSYQTVDVSANVDAGATGAILLIANQGGADYVYHVREMGSTDSVTNLDVEQYHNSLWMVGLNASKQFQAYIANTNVKIFLVGQTKGSVVFNANDVAVTDPTTGSWQPIDADTYSVPAAANGVVLYIANTAAQKVNDYRLSIRHGDSTDSWNGDIGGRDHTLGAIGINGANVWGEYMENTSLDVKIAGYTRLVRLDVHADMDVVIRQANGVIRTTIGTNVANSGNITGATWATFTATYSFPGYTVVDGTDYLEIDLYSEATANSSGESVSVDFRIDDNTLATTDQTRVMD